MLVGILIKKVSIMYIKMIFLVCLFMFVVVFGWLLLLIVVMVRGEDQQYVFDFYFGMWKIEIKSCDVMVVGVGQWIVFIGMVIDQLLWNGKVNLEKIEVFGMGGYFQGLMLFFYNFEFGQWSEQFVGSGDGMMQLFIYGEFKDGCGVFYGWIEFDGKKVFE